MLERYDAFLSYAQGYQAGANLMPSIVPKAIPGRLQFDRWVGKGGAGVVY